MNLWHLTNDAPRQPARPIPGERVKIFVGCWPADAALNVAVKVAVVRESAPWASETVAAAFSHNGGPNSYYCAEIGPFEKGDQVSYTVEAMSNEGPVESPGGKFRVGPRLYLALLWHQHQPLYRDTSKPPRGAYRKPWVRLHALRDYYSMPAMVAEHPGVHVTFNLTGSLLSQILDYTDNGATDDALDLTLTPSEDLGDAERARLLATFFDADRDRQIAPHPRYLELLEKRDAGQPFSIGELRDLQMWFNLAWFGDEFRRGPVKLVTGEVVSVHRFVEKDRGFDGADIEAMVAEQLKILRAVVPIHRELQDCGQIEVATSPFYHPIIPLLIDTDRATVDLPGAQLPSRFAHPEDADAQIALAVELYRRLFGRAPIGMWPSEGAVAEFAIASFARNGVTWLATDEGVLARSGGGYDVSNADVLCRPYRVGGAGGVLSMFFRATRPSDRIGFELSRDPNPERAAESLLEEVREVYARSGGSGDDRIFSIVLDGENAWGSYQNDGRPFLHALYRRLEADREIETVTLAEYLAGDRARGLPAHPSSEQRHVHDLFTGSWIDEKGSRPGVDLGTWIGEPEENRAWELLRATRAKVESTGATPSTAPKAFEALYAAEGSDWFWWLGEDQDSGNDRVFDELFRMHLSNVYSALGLPPPPELAVSVIETPRGP